MSDTSPPATPLRVLAVRDAVGWLLVPVAEIIAFHAEDEGTVVSTVRGDSHLVSTSLARLESRLPADRFERISRRAIVALPHIARIEPEEGGLLAVRLRNGVRLVASRQQSRRLRRELLSVR
jgi:DNA-binding LytR/AlgR family response regulator